MAAWWLSEARLWWSCDEWWVLLLPTEDMTLLVVWCNFCSMDKVAWTDFLEKVDKSWLVFWSGTLEDSSGTVSTSGGTFDAELFSSCSFAKGCDNPWTTVCQIPSHMWCVSCACWGSGEEEFWGDAIVSFGSSSMLSWLSLLLFPPPPNARTTCNACSWDICNEYRLCKRARISWLETVALGRVSRDVWCKAIIYSSSLTSAAAPVGRVNRKPNMVPTRVFGNGRVTQSNQCESKSSRTLQSFTVHNKKKMSLNLRAWNEKM